jgi:hypothetical protein
MPYKDKEAQKKFQRDWIAKRREDLLVNKTCRDCSSTSDLNFVNVKNGGKKFSYSYSGEKLKEKLADAIVLCEDCNDKFQRNTRKEKSTTHGKTNSSTYMSWRSMISRCNNLNADNYKWYGGRGVTVCERWETFENFYLDMGDRPANMTLDRIDPWGNYEPTNCRWATASEQGANKRKKI